MIRRSLAATLSLAALSGTLLVGGAAPANAYAHLGCKWGSAPVRVYIPSPLTSAPIWSNAVSNWSGTDAQLTSSYSSVFDANNENRGNTVNWSGIFRTKNTVQQGPYCNSGRFVAGQTEVVLNLSAMDNAGYSTTRKTQVAAHELGHAMGLAHTENTYTLMYKQDAGRNVNVPQRDDKDGVNALY